MTGPDRLYVELTRRLAVIEGGADIAELAPGLAAAEERCDLHHVTEHLPEALGQSEAGIERINAIVRSVKDFAHPERTEVKLVDINAAVQSTLTLARFEDKDVADVVTELGPLPLVACNGGEINQVVLGTTFTIRLPARGDDPAPRVRAA